MVIEREDARQLGKLITDLTKEKLAEDGRHEVAVALTTVFAEALVALFPEKAKDGRTILQIIGEQIAVYPIARGLE